MFRKFHLSEIEEIIKNSPEETVIYIGTDSVQRGDRCILATVVIVHHGKAKGANVFSKVELLPRVNSITHRIMIEVTKAVEVGLILFTISYGRDIEIHLDINPSAKHLSNKVFKEAQSYVSSQGFKPVFKPHSFAAYCVADYVCKKYS